MERRMRISLAKLAGAAAVSLSFLVCSNPIDIAGSVQNQVMASHNMFLVVGSASPAKGAQVSPGSAVTIQFDRSIDPSTATSSTIVFTPAITWHDSSYNDSSKTLTITPAMLQGGQSYTATVTTGVRGTDGSSVQASYTWNFTTRNEPAGTFVIQTSSTTGLAHDNAYTNDPNIKLLVSANQLVNQMSVVEVGSPVSKAWMASTNQVNFSLNAVDGTKTIQMEFADVGPTFTTPPYSQVVTLDRAAPTSPSLVINGGATLTNSLSVTLSPSATDTLSGLYQMQFSNDNSTWSAWEAYAATKTWSLASGDGTKTVYVKLSDKAGNPSAAASHTITLDQTPPGAPAVNGTSGSGTSLPGNYSWTPGTGDGVRIYRYKINSGSWSAETSSTSYTPSSLDYGPTVLYVQERDAAGNWSASGTSSSYFYYPSWLRPAYQATGVSRTPTTFVFAPSGALYKFTPAWDLAYGTSSLRLDTLVSNLTVPTYQITLSAGTTYYWVYRLKNKLTGAVQYTSPMYSFTTVELIRLP